MNTVIPSGPNMTGMVTVPAGKPWTGNPEGLPSVESISESPETGLRLRGGVLVVPMVGAYGASDGGRMGAMVASGAQPAPRLVDRGPGGIIVTGVHWCLLD